MLNKGTLFLKQYRIFYCDVVYRVRISYFAHGCVLKDFQNRGQFFWTLVSSVRDNGEIAAKFGALGAKSIENVM